MSHTPEAIVSAWNSVSVGLRLSMCLWLCLSVCVCVSRLESNFESVLSVRPVSTLNFKVHRLM